MSPSQISSAEGDGNFLCTNLTTRSSLSSNPNNGRVAGAAAGKEKDTETQMSANVLDRQATALQGTTPGFWVFFFDWEPLKTAANGFQNILHLFIAKRADHEVCGGHDTKKNYNLREGKAVKI